VSIRTRPCAWAEHVFEARFNDRYNPFWGYNTTLLVDRYPSGYGSCKIIFFLFLSLSPFLLSCLLRIVIDSLLVFSIFYFFVILSLVLHWHLYLIHFILLAFCITFLHSLRSSNVTSLFLLYRQFSILSVFLRTIISVFCHLFYLLSFLSSYLSAFFFYRYFFLHFLLTFVSYFDPVMFLPLLHLAFFKYFSFLLPLFKLTLGVHPLFFVSFFT
jgi:hypothetical protein